MLRGKFSRTCRAAVVAAVAGFFVASGVIAYASPSEGNNDGAAAWWKNADCADDKDTDRGPDSRCVEDEAVVTDIVIISAPEASADDPAADAVSAPATKGQGKANSNGKGKGGNPDCNTSGPDRACGEEDGDHNQGGACDGNEGNRKKTCDTDDGENPRKLPPSMGITLDKSGPSEVDAGGTIKYTFEVTNSGKAKLKSVNLTDAGLGISQSLPDLRKGQSAVVTASSTAPDSGTVTNTAEACGSVGKKTICDTDTHAVTVNEAAQPPAEVLGTRKPGNAGTLPTTGFELLLWVAGGVNLVSTGGAMMFLRRRRRA